MAEAQAGETEARMVGGTEDGATGAVATPGGAGVRTVGTGAETGEAHITGIAEVRMVGIVEARMMGKT